MKKSYAPFFITVLFALGVMIYFPVMIFAQNLRFSEVSGDSGNNDGTNDGIIELINTGNVPFDAGCYVISNAEWVVVLPPGTIINPGEVFLIACSEGQNSGTNPNPLPTSGLTCATCDFPNLPIDFDVCDPVNADYVDWAATGFTIDNQNDTDGDQIVLFAPDGSIVQALKWGGGATSGFDNTALQSNNYTLGTPGTGGVGLSSAQLPPTLQVNGSCYSSGVNYVMPVITDGVYEDLTTAPNPDGKTINNTVLQGCNSSFIYDPISDTWSKTDHPNPGLQNDVPAYHFSFSVPLTQCENAIESITVMLEVYNWQAVTPGITNAKGGVGSFVSFDGGATPIPWDTYLRNDATGITTLTYTFTPTINQTMSLVWDDDKSSPLASTPTGSTSYSAVVKNTTPSDCYVSEKYPIQIIPAMTTQKTEIVCPDDFPTGTVNIGSLISGGQNVVYELFDNGISQNSNTTGIFSISEDLVGPITVRVTDASGCSAPITINIDNSCRQIPPCPELIAGTDSDDDDMLCPGDEVCFEIPEFADLPAGGTIDYYFSNNADFDPYQGEGTLLGSAAINSTSPTCPDDGANVLITELGDHPNADCERFIEIFNAGPCDADLSAYKLAVVLNGAESSFNLSGTLSVGNFLVFGPTNDYSIGGAGAACNGAYTDIEIDFDEFLFNGQAWDGARLYKNNVLVDDAVIDPSSSSAAYADKGWERSATITSPSAIYNSSEWSAQDVSPSAQSVGTRSLASGAGSTTTVDPFCYIFDETFCNLTANGAFYIKAVINPFTESMDCSSADANRAQSFTFSMICPIATLSGNSNVCAPNSGIAIIEITNGGSSNMISGNITNDINDFPFSGTTQPDGSALINVTNIDQSGDYTIKNITIENTCLVKISGTASVVINPLPDVAIAANSIEICEGLVAQIPITINNGNLPLQISYNINGGNTQILAVFNDQINLPTTGLSLDNYTLNLITVSDDNGCAGTASGSTNISIHQRPNAGNNYWTTICGKNQPLQLLGFLANADDNGVWSLESAPQDPGDNFNANAGTFNPFGLKGGDYIFRYTISGMDVCEDSYAILTLQVIAQNCGNFPWNGER